MTIDVRLRAFFTSNVTWFTEKFEVVRDKKIESKDTYFKTLSRFFLY